MDVTKNFKLIITIITPEKSTKVFDAIAKEGVTKSTVIPGRGKSDRNPKWFFGVPIEPQRDCILTMVQTEKADKIFDLIMREGELDKPLHGMVFMVDAERVGGVDLDFFKQTVK